MPYVAVQQLLDGGAPKGMQNYWTADFLAELPDEAIDVLVEHATEPGLAADARSSWSPAAARRPGWARRRRRSGSGTAPWNIHYLSMWPDPADTERNIAYTQAIAAAMKPWTTGRVYLNYIGDEGEDRVEASFGEKKFARLRELKQQWDPQNLFRHNQNIPPPA